MKLLFCKKCSDVFRLFDDLRVCACGETSGRYLNNLDAIYGGSHAIPLGFVNDSFAEAITGQPESGLGRRFDAFVIPKTCFTFQKE